MLSQGVQRPRRTQVEWDWIAETYSINLSRLKFLELTSNECEFAIRTLLLSLEVQHVKKCNAFDPKPQDEVLSGLTV